MDSSATWGAGPTPILGAEAKSQFEQALRDIPVDEKASYLEAVRVTPHLVDTESDPIRFLRVDDGNASKAAARLCMYWKKRAQIFGERAFLSLRDCSGSGALDEVAVRILDKGAAVQLPDDVKGSPVFCSDPSRLDDGLKTPGKVRLQVMFHVLDKVAESNPMSQSRGVILLRVVTEADFDRTNLGQAMAILEQALPLKIKVLRILCVPPPGAKRMFEQTALPVYQKAYSEVWGDRAKVHVAASATELGRKLKTKGLRKSGLPLSCGGKWKYDNWETGVSQKDIPPRSIPTEVDEQEPVGQSQPRERTPQAPENGASKGKDTNLHANRGRPEPTMNVTNLTKLPAPCNDAIGTTSAGRWRDLDVLAMAAKDTRIKDRIERKRKNDIVYSRQKREREKACIDKLQDVWLELSTSNTSLQGENNKFERMLKDAEERVVMEEARDLATHTVSVQRDSRVTTRDELISGLLRQQLHTRQNQTIAISTVASLEGTQARFGRSQQVREDQTVSLVNMGNLESVLAGQNQTMVSSTAVSLDGILARFGELQQERRDQTAPLVNRVDLESVFAGLISQLQRPNSEEWRVISQIPLDPRQQQQSQASILLASLHTDTLQSLMTGAPALAAQPANTALHRQEPSQLMPLGFKLEQALECYRYESKSSAGSCGT